MWCGDHFPVTRYDTEMMHAVMNKLVYIAAPACEWSIRATVSRFLQRNAQGKSFELEVGTVYCQ
jgi:hypothetical protein